LGKIFDEIISKSLNDFKKKKFHDEVAPTSKSLNLKFWYSKDVITRLQILKYHIFQIDSKDTKDFFKVCFSLTSRKASYQRNSIYKIYRMDKSKLQKFKPDVFSLFEQICKRNIDKMSEFASTKLKNTKAIPILGNTKNIVEIF